MQVQIHARNLDVPAPLASSIEGRLAKLADRYRFLQESHVVLSRQRNMADCELTLHVRHQILRAKERDPDLAAAVDRAIEKLEKQLGRHKGRLHARSRAGDVKEAPALTTVPVEAPEEEYEAPRVVKVKRIAVKPMSVEEAALQMELLGHDFYVFTNDESEGLNVIYRRHNGDIGLIQPE
jgi:putative sigma-54 modulation protein